MDKEVDPQVLAAVNEKRLSGPRLTPVEIVERMGVPAAREKAYDHAWLAAGDGVVAPVWAEHVAVGSAGRWFCLEPLDPRLRAGGGTRAPNQVQRATDRLVLLKRCFDAEQDLRVVLQTNRVAIGEIESSRSAKVSTRVRDDTPWHVARWDAVAQLAVLVRGPRGWLPSDDELRSGLGRRGMPEAAAAQAGGGGPAHGGDLQSAALAYVTRHFTGYGYGVKDLREQQPGYDIEVSSPKGDTLLRVAVRGTAPGADGFALTAGEQAAAGREKLWRLLVVADPLGPGAQHKIYKADEVEQAPGFEPAG